MTIGQYPEYTTILPCEGETYVGRAKVYVHHMVLSGQDHGYRVYIEELGRNSEDLDDPHVFEYLAEDEADAIRMFKHITATNMIQQEWMESQGFMYC